MFQRAMLLAVVVFFCQSVIHPMKWHLLLRATAYMKSNLLPRSITSDLEKREENWSPCFCIYLIS